MSVKSLTAMAHVHSVSRAIVFYEKLGFTVRNTHAAPGESEPVWAWITSDGANLMLAQADGPFDPGQQAVLFYLYCPDVAEFRAQLAERGVEVGPISYPFWAPKGEFRVMDPDGYVLMITHT